MPWLLTLRRRRRALQPLAALALALLLACSGDEANGPTPHDPDGPPVPPPTQPQPNEPPLPNEPPVPVPNDPTPPDQPPADNLTGVYVLSQINDGTPGQLITIANPDGSVAGLYRFSGGTLGMTGDGTWDLSLEYTDDKVDFELEDLGVFTQNGSDLVFQSEVYGDQFPGSGRDGVVAFRYDFDGDGETDVVFGFVRILPPGS